LIDLVVSFGNPDHAGLGSRPTRALDVDADGETRQVALALRQQVA